MAAVTRHVTVHQIHPKFHNKPNATNNPSMAKWLARAMRKEFFKPKRAGTEWSPCFLSISISWVA